MSLLRVSIHNLLLNTFFEILITKFELFLKTLKIWHCDRNKLQAFLMEVILVGQMWLSWAILVYLELSRAISGYLGLHLSRIKYQDASRSRSEQVNAIGTFCYCSSSFFSFFWQLLKKSSHSYNNCLVALHLWFLITLYLFLCFYLRVSV